MTPPLTDSLSRALTFLRDFQAEHGYAPTRKELADGLQYKSPNGAQDVLKRLEKHGFISMEVNQARCIRIHDDAKPADLLLSGVVMAIAERDMGKAHGLLLKATEDTADQMLSDLIPTSASAKFLVRQLPFVVNQIRSIYERVEGEDGASEKCDAAIRILTLSFLPFSDFSDSKEDIRTVTGKTFRSESELFRFFDAIQEMHAGNGERYFEFIRHHGPTKKKLGSELRSRHQYFTRTQTDLPLREMAQQA